MRQAFPCYDKGRPMCSALSVERSPCGRFIRAAALPALRRDDTLIESLGRKRQQGCHEVCEGYGRPQQQPGGACRREPGRVPHPSGSCPPGRSRSPAGPADRRPQPGRQSYRAKPWRAPAAWCPAAGAVQDGHDGNSNVISPWCRLDLRTCGPQAMHPAGPGPIWTCGTSAPSPSGPAARRTSGQADMQSQERAVSNTGRS